MRTYRIKHALFQWTDIPEDNVDFSIEDGVLWFTDRAGKQIILSGPFIIEEE